MKRFAVKALTTAMLLSLTACSSSSSTAATTAASGGTLEDGTYTATAAGLNDDVEVSVTVEGGKITAAEVTSNSETPGIGAPLLDKDGNVCTAGGLSPIQLIPQEVVEQQTLAVDNVTGATITSYAVKTAIGDCIEQAGGNLDEWKANEYKPEAYTDASADIVVVGGGGAGLAAAITAAQQGKNVIIVEKAGEIGGDTLVCGAIYNCPDEELQSQVTMTEPVKATIEAALATTSDDPEKQAVLEEMQAAVQTQWDEYLASGRTDLFDSKEWYALQTWLGGDMVANPELVKVLTYNAYDGLLWIEDLGMEFDDQIAQGAGSLWQRTHTSTMDMGTGFLSTYANQLASYSDNITLYVEATAEELVMTDGRVTGVKCLDNHNETEFTVTGTDGVILTTGGFSANGSMIQEYNTSGKWPDLSDTATTNRFSASQGDGISMAVAVGASLTDMDQIQLLYLGNLQDGTLTKYPPRDVNGVDQLIFINKNGERFVREDGRRDEICLAILQQPDAMFYMLESGDGSGYVDITDPDWRSADGFTFQYLVDNGYVVYDDTLAGLAEKLGMDADTLQATVDAFNAAVDSGTDEFGRTLFSTKLENGPWVATARQACIHHTMGGVTIDTEAHVLDADGNIIEGLYAAGEVTGGIHGGNRLGGNAVVDTVVFGKLAGDTCVAEAE